MNQEYIYKRIGKIVFGMLSPKTIKKMAATKIVTAELYDKEGYPVDGGLMDIHLGVIDPGLRCKTCSGKLKECPGHFGYVELARPVIHVKYVKKILILLRSTCRECGHILALPKDIQDKNIKGAALVKYLMTVKTCPHCNAKQIKVKFEKPSTFLEGDKRLTPIEILARFEKLTDDEVEILGMNSKYARPENMILTLLPVPPVTTRPSITLETGERSEDDLTHKLGDIVRINQRLFENINAGAPEVIVEDLWDLLQYHITTYFDNETSQVPPARHRSGQPLKTLSERIKSKEGRFRHNLVGKRVNFAARTVISPDPKIEFNEVGVPHVIAIDLTIPEKVTEWNLNWIKKFVDNGPGIYPGANYIITEEGKKKKITDDSKKQILEELKSGYIVERHIMDGDICIFNRQPSLHRMSIMCHRIKVMPGRSFRLNPSVCVAPDTKVMMSDGYIREIKDLKDYKDKEIITCNWEKDREIENSGINKFHEVGPKKHKFNCYKITTKTGKNIKVTEDHPFYTQRGILPAKLLEINDKVAIYPIELPEYEERKDIILMERDILKFVPKHSNVNHVIKTLKKLELLPLKMNNPKLPILVRLIAHILGDGTLSNVRSGSNGINRKSLTIYLRGNFDDLKSIKNDINKMGFNYKQKIISKISKSEIKTFKEVKNVLGVSTWFSIKSQPLGSLLLALGTPSGRKTNVRYRIPRWLFKSPLFIQRNFLASYFGSELSKPRLGTRSKKSMSAPVFKIQKRYDLVKNGKELAKDFSKLLKNFGVDILNIKIEDGNIRKDGSKTYSVVTEISSKINNLKNLFGKIGYIYASKKEKLARLTYHYLENKDLLIKEQVGKLYKTKLLYSKNYLPNDIAKILDIPRGTVSSWLYRKPPTNQYVKKDFLNFNEFIKNSTEGLSNTGVVWEKIKEKKEIKQFIAQDITTISKNHNFIANSFVVGNCTPYNADFDGDEMNLHIPQTEEARAEAEILMQVQSHIITPKNGLNVVGTVLDAVTGNYILTKELEFKREDAVQLLYNIGIKDFSRLKKEKSLHGKDIFSVLLPSDFDFIGQNKSDEDVIIKNGKLIQGYIDKATIGEDNGTLIRAIYKKYGEDKGLEIMGMIFKLGIEVLLKSGFTTGIKDTDLSDELVKKNKEKIDKTLAEIDDLIKQYKNNKLTALPGLTLDQTLENLTLQLLNKLRDEVGETVYDNVLADNSTVLMVKSGAQGNFLNIAQMAAMVGQQVLRGTRVHLGYKNRTLSTFEPGSLDAESRGFVKNSYRSGLTPAEYFFHAMTGRDSLMDTALRTPKSGYLYRRLANALQDIKVEYDGTVRDANKRIIQFKYGDDGLDVSKTEGGIINVKRIVKEVSANV